MFNIAKVIMVWSIVRSVLAAVYPSLAARSSSVISTKPTMDNSTICELQTATFAMA